MDFILILLAAYLIGSIPFGLILTRLFGYGDIRKIGSGNIGATNVLRTGNKKLAAATLILDFTKGAVAVFLGKFTTPLYTDLFTWMTLTGTFAIIGHMFPLWLQFKGGKGVATFLGMITALIPICSLIFVGIWLAIAGITRFSSAGALTATFSVLVAFFFLSSENFPALSLILAIVILIYYQHRANIVRLLNGTESRIGQKS